MELQSRLADLNERGIGLAVITYDPPATLKAFADRRGITFRLLSDEGSKTIRAYGLFNSEVAAGTRGYGIPYPGTFFLDATGKVTARYFESAYQERSTVSRILLDQGRKPVAVAERGTKYTTKHLDVVAYTSDEVVAPGQRVSLLLDVTPAKGIHIYAPPQTEYIPIALELKPAPDLRVFPPKFPASEKYEFKPLKEIVQVYMKPFRLTQDVTLQVTPATREAAGKPNASMVFAGTLSYQACDDALCYPPADVAVAWTVKLKNLEQ